MAEGWHSDDDGPVYLGSDGGEFHESRNDPFENLLPEFRVGGSYGWQISFQAGKGPGRLQDIAMDMDLAIDAAAKRESSESTAAKARKIKVHRSEKEGYMQFFRPGSVLRDHVPEQLGSVAPRPASSLGATTDFGVDSLFLTRPPVSPERKPVKRWEEDFPVDRRRLEAKSSQRRARASKIDEQYQVEGRSQPSERMRRGRKTRGSQGQRVTDAKQTGGTEFCIVNLQESETSAFISSPGGKMGIISVRSHKAIATSTRVTGQRKKHLSVEDAFRSDADKPHSTMDLRGTNRFVFALTSPNVVLPLALASQPTSDPVAIKFCNCGTRNLHAYWVDYNGHFVSRMCLLPGETCLEVSYNEHFWFLQTAVRHTQLKRWDVHGDTSPDGASRRPVEDHQGLLVKLAKIPEVNGDAMNLVFNPASGHTSISKLSLSSSARIASGASKVRSLERAALAADSRVVANPLRREKNMSERRHYKQQPRLREKAIAPPGLKWGDRRAGRRPASAGRSSRRAIEILRDRKFAQRRIRHSTRVVRMRDVAAGATAPGITITVCPSAEPLR